MSENVWKSLFENWAPSVPRRGLCLTKQGESIMFVAYLLSPGIVLLERDKPDSSGGRKVMVSYDDIACVKIIDPLELARFQAMGFAPPPS